MNLSQIFKEYMMRLMRGRVNEQVQHGIKLQQKSKELVSKFPEVVPFGIYCRISLLVFSIEPS